MKKKTRVNITCPNCGVSIQITGTLEQLKVEHPKTEKEILACFDSKDRPHLDVVIEGNFAKITLKGKFNRKRFGRVSSEVRGYGGRWVKGYFKLPLAGLDVSDS